MIQLKKNIFSTAIFFLILFTASTQDFPYSQFYANPLYLNPALAGSEYCSRINLNYRNQWPSLPGMFTSSSFSFDRFSEFLNGGLGLQLNYDKQGEVSINQLMVSGMYAYRLTISPKVEANMALQATYGQRGLNLENMILPSGLQSNNQTPVVGIAEDVKYIDFASGFLIGFNEKYFLGGAVHHPTQPEIGFLEEHVYKMKMKITLHGGANFGGEKYHSRYSSSEIVVSPNILYQQQGNFKHINIGSYFTYEPLVVGLWLRHGLKVLEVFQDYYIRTTLAFYASVFAN
jgi:type IX secretion system PorP/SprF family membrane protein